VTGPGAPEPGQPNIYPLHAGVPGFPGEALDALLDGKPLTARAAAGTPAAPGLARVAELLSALTAPPAPDELAGHVVALAEFRGLSGMPGAPPEQEPARTPAPVPATAGRRPLRTAVASWVAAALLGAVVALGGVAAAAYLGVLPGPMQQWVHNHFRSVPTPVSQLTHTPQPTPHPQASPSSAAGATSPGAAIPGRHTSPPGQTSPAARTSPASSAPASTPAVAGFPGAAGTCNAWDHASPSARAHSARFRQLITAAGGAANVPAYCASVTGSPSP
jgi:hypothetical protein